MKPPSTLFLMLEAIRSVYEYGQGIILYMPLQYISPKGDGHPVVIFPGLGTADSSTYFIRRFLSSIGYNVYSWGFGRNLGPKDGMNKFAVVMEAQIRAISAANGGAKVSLIGGSLGGLYAREISKLSPDLVRQVITLGTPFKNIDKSTNASMLYEFLSKDKTYKNPIIAESLARCPPVPFTSIYSKTDGVVSWESSIEVETELSQNIEIPGASHLGLGHNPISMYVIANRLAQPEGAWCRYKPFG